MPRQPRLHFPNLPLHLVQRGNDRQPCFLDDRDRRRYLDDLRVLARENACAVHAYVLMTNHVHLRSPHPVYLALGGDLMERQRAYREFVAESVPGEEADLIRRQPRRQHPLGPEAFTRMLEDLTRQRAGPCKRGRPVMKEGAAPCGAAPPESPIIRKR